MTPVGTPGGLGPSPPSHRLPINRSTAEADTRELHWIAELGGFLTVHASHGYSRWEQLATTDTVVRGRTVVGLYFSADWCQPCKLFTPLLKRLHAGTRAHCTDANRNIPPFEIVLVSRCKEAKDTERYFADMPWAAMEHNSATGRQGLALMKKYGVSTIPALVLLDGAGALICNCGQEHLRKDPTGNGFPWPAPISGPRPAQVSFALPPRAEAVPKKPTGKPPPFPQPRRSTAGLPVGRPVGLPVGRPVGQPDQITAHGGTLEGHPGTIEQSPTTATARSSTRKREHAETVRRPKPPPKPNITVRNPPPCIHPDALAALAVHEAQSTVAFTPRRLMEPLPPEPEGKKPTSLMQPQPLAAAHPFTPTLKSWRHGIEVDCGPDWSWDVIEAAVARGPHPTASTPAAIDLFQEDIEYQVKAGFCKVMLWEDIKRLRPNNLKISPVAVVPQVGRRGRIILDLSFPVYQDVNGVVTATQASVNDTTALRAPSVPVKEIGRVFPRLLHYMRDTPAGLHILFSKLDISDGFWRLIVQEADCFNFAYVLPQAEGEPCRIVVPAAVQMGWVESPSLFCTVTETARDLTQHFVDSNIELPIDPLEDSMDIENVPKRARTSSPTRLLQVYVDDFCYAATQSDDGAHIPLIRRAAIHGIHAVFPPTSVTNHEGGKEPISAKKLAAGDGNFNTKKEMIGFSFDGVKRTVQLPLVKAKAYITETHTMLRRKTVPLKKLQMLVGKLRHAAIILPAAKGFFTPLNDAMRGSPKIIGLGIHSEVRRALLDLISLLHLLSSRPTHVRELVPDMPTYAGYHDAAAEGAGGVWFSLVDDTPPAVWREAFPADIAAEVVSEDTPHGRLTNSDLELAAEVLAVGIALDRITNTKHVPLGTLCDNTPTVSWIDKMASKSKSPTAGRLLRGLAFMLYCAHAGRLTTVHVPGVDNIMADIASRPSKAQKLFRAESPLSDLDFCSSFDTTFPLPDNQSWSLAIVPQWLRFNVFETLRGKRLDLLQWMGPNANATGKRGKRTAGSTATTPATPLRKGLSRTGSSPLLSPCGKASTVSEIRSRFSPLQKPSGSSPKSSFWTDIRTPDEPLQPSTP